MEGSVERFFFQMKNPVKIFDYFFDACYDRGSPFWPFFSER